MWAQLLCANFGNMDAEGGRGRIRAAAGRGRGRRRGAGNSDTASPLHPRSLQHSPHYSLSGHTVVQDRPEQPQFVVIWDNVSFHWAALVRDQFTSHNIFIALNLPPYTPFLNLIEELCLAWHWKVYDHQPHAHMPLLQAMEEACGDIEVRSIQSWIRHAKRYFPVAWQGRTFPVMWMRWCGQMPTVNRIHSLNDFQSLPYNAMFCSSFFILVVPCLCVLYFYFCKNQKNKKNSKVFTLCFHVSGLTVVDQSFTQKICMRLLKSKTIQSTEYSCVLYKAHLCVFASRKE